MTECRNCRDWRGCIHDGQWFSYSDVRFCALQCFWILKHAEELREGRWPLPDERAETTNRGHKVIPEAPFAKVIAIMAEVDMRVGRLPQDKGRLLEAQCILKESIYYLDHDVREALYYISGWKRKRSFSHWLKDRRYRQKNDKYVVMAKSTHS